MAFYIMAAQCVRRTESGVVTRLAFSVGVHPNEQEAKKCFYYEAHEELRAELSAEPGGNSWAIQPVELRPVSEEMIRMAYAELIKGA